ncbi:MAG: hypothetical protein ACF8Q5_10600 [Phycisphaerales bacterium JB040]
MPHVVNGIGTWYWGRRNTFTRRDLCPHCGASVELRSFDTRKYFVLLFVPVLPMGTLRIVDECPSCTKHSRVKHATWQRQIVANVQTSADIYRAQHTRDQAVEVIAGSVASQDRALFEELESDIESRFPSDAELLDALATGHAFFERRDDADRVWEASRAITDADATAARHCYYLLLWGRLDDAEPSVRRFLDRPEIDHTTLYALYLDALLSAGRAEDALSTMDGLEQRLPELEEKKVFKPMRKQAEKLVAKPTKYRGVTGWDPATPLNENRAAWSIISYIPYIAVLGLGMGYLTWAQVASAGQSAHLLNATDAAYTVTIAGDPITLSPGLSRDVALGAGVHDVTQADPAPWFEPFQLDLSVNFFAAPFVRRTVVVNPDRVGVIEYESTTYSTTGNASLPSDAYMLHAGEPVYDFGKIDHPFEAFPAEVELPGNNAVARNRVGVLAADPFTIAVHMEGENPGTGQAWLRDYVRVVPTDADGVQSLAALATEEDLPLFEELGAQRPLLMEAHRASQTLREPDTALDDLLAEYDALRREVAGTPDEPVADYLYARLLPRLDEAEPLLRTAMASGHPDAAPRARVSLVFGFLAAARYADAAELSENPDGPLQDDLIALRTDAVVGVGDLEAIATHADSYADWIDPVLLAWVEERRGRADRGASILREYASGTTDGVLDTDNEYLAELMALLDIASGRIEAAASFWRNSQYAEDALAAAMLDRDPEALALALDEFEPDSIDLNTLLLSALATPVVDPSHAGYLGRAVSALSQGDAEQRQCAAWLNAESAPDPGDVRQLTMQLYLKRLVVANLALRFPEEPAFSSFARELNADPRYPAPVVTRALDAAATTDSGG